MVTTAPRSTAAPWDEPLALGDHESALTVWRSHCAGREHEIAARRALAEIEERSGDARVVHDGLSAKGHYLRAADAAREAMDAVARVASADVGKAVQRLQTDYARAFRKYQSISNQGRVDDLIGLKPHPASAALRAHIDALRQERRTEQGARRQRLAALLDALDGAPTQARAELDAAMEGSAYARASGMGGDAMASFELGDRWMGAAQALADAWPASARRALAWSAWFFRRYHAHWSANMPASRFEPDGRDGYESADEMRASLMAGRDPGEPPAWARELLAGRVPRALEPADDAGDPRAFAPLFELLLAAAPQLRPGDRRWT